MKPFWVLLHVLFILCQPRTCLGLALTTDLSPRLVGWPSVGFNPNPTLPQNSKEYWLFVQHKIYNLSFFRTKSSLSVGFGTRRYITILLRNNIPRPAKKKRSDTEGQSQPPQPECRIQGWIRHSNPYVFSTLDQKLLPKKSDTLENRPWSVGSKGGSDTLS